MRVLVQIAAALGAAALAGMFLYGVLGPAPRASTAPVVPPRDAPAMLSPRADGGPVRILLLGTSLTARGSWPRILEERLASCAPRGVEVTRLARAGENSHWGLAALRQRLADASQPLPDIVVSEFSGNDASVNRGMPLFLSRSAARSLIRTIRRAGAVPFLSTMSPAWEWEAVTRPGLARYHAMYRELAGETGAGLIDTAPAWLAIPDDLRKSLVPDGGHPTDDGMRRIALPILVAALRPLVCG